MAQLGRNDPCPCGSGKKYKKCCLTRHEALLTKEALRLRDLALDLLARLRDFADDNLTRADLAKARIAFLGKNEDPLQDREADLRALEDGADHGGRLLMDWLIFSRRENADAPTFLERFLETEAAGLTAEERGLLGDWQSSYRGVFEVLTVFPGVSLVLKDIYTEETTEVAEAWVSSRYDLWPADLLYARPLKARPFDRLATGALLLSRDWRPRFEDWHEEAADRVRQGNPDATHAAIMNVEAPSLHRLVVDLLLNPPDDDLDEDLFG